MKYAVGDAVSHRIDKRSGVVISAGIDREYRVRWDGGASDDWVHELTLEPAALQYTDPVQSPSHYDLPGGLKVIDIVRDESFLRGNIIKYVLRAPYKNNELEDMRKALRYLTWEIERLENEQSS